jgi:epoxyqueuosine reductase QueG
MLSTSRISHRFASALSAASLFQTAVDYLNTSPLNYVSKEIALAPELVGLRLLEPPLIAFASADDPLFLKLREPGVIGEHFLLPTDWVPGARTVISLFFPWTDRVKAANRIDPTWPAKEWLHGRIEGIKCKEALCEVLSGLLNKHNFLSVAPLTDPRFSTQSPITDDPSKQDHYTSNWSERHVAFVAGLGTFGLQRGLITAKGAAGALGSIVTTMEFEPTQRPYTGIYEYCTRCGICATRCPVGAISLEGGKQHPPCAARLAKVRAKEHPRYGCGKCYGGPCESRIPGRNRGK